MREPANQRTSEPNVRAMRAMGAMRALRATEKHRHDRLCSLSFRSLASPLSRSEKYEIQTMGANIIYRTCIDRCVQYSPVGDENSVDRPNTIPTTRDGVVP